MGMALQQQPSCFDGTVRAWGDGRAATAGGTVAVASGCGTSLIGRPGSVA
jgi:hypothetical protein